MLQNNCLAGTNEIVVGEDLYEVAKKYLIIVFHQKKNLLLN